MDINTCATIAASLGDIRALALYANLVPAAMSLVLAGFVLFRAIDRSKAYVFAGFVCVFALWLVGNAIVWTSNDYYLVAGFWSPLAYLELLFFLVLFCFFYIDIYSHLPRAVSIVVILIAAVSLFVNLAGQSIAGFELVWCNMHNSEFLNVYNLWVDAIVLFTVASLGLLRIAKLHNQRSELIRVAIVTGSIVLFMGVFAGSSYVSSVGAAVYTTELYALFTLPIFILALTISITSYGTFNLGNAVAKMFFLIFMVLSGSQFFFVSSTAGFVLAAIAFLMTLSFGLLLLRSYEREGRIRKQMEDIAVELQTTNERQEVLFHFIGHEVKGFLTKDAGAFASLSEGDFGALPVEAKSFIEQALAETRSGADSVGNILKASNLKKGSVTYEKKPFDLKELVAATVARAKSVAEKKGLDLSFTADDASYQMVGDQAQLADHVFRNLIENSLNYTPSGSVAVSLKKEAGKLVFAVKDTGVGISDEDKKLLFTEGGHGKDSQKVNAHSTGYGLYIAKQVAEAHGGTIRAESEGVGKGATFVVEFPTV